MNKLKVCFVGVGSIAKRHIKNLRSICAEDDVELIIDVLRRKPNSLSREMDKLIGKTYFSISALPNDYDAIFITNPTHMHLTTLREMQDKGKNFFIEKPIVSLNQLEEIENYKEKKDAVYYVACPLRYNAVIQYIAENVDKHSIISVRSISSSYLPEWRPEQDYRSVYSAHKDLGGGVSIDLIHEWDYLTYLFGMPQKIASMIGKKSDLEIDSDDYAVYIAEYENMMVELHLDYFGRKAIREIMMIAKEDTIVGDIANNRIIFMKSGQQIEFHEHRDDYQKRELRHFINMIQGFEVEDSTISHAIKILKLTQGEL